jgi:hypothetical protein
MRISKARLERLAEQLEDRACKYGRAAMQPIGMRVGPNDEGMHTRTNRVKLSFLSSGLNEAANALRAVLAGKEPDL